MKTEAEAIECWCPFAKTKSDHWRENVPGDYTPSARCIGSACMAWRWETELTPYKATPEMLAARNGYCGLAGKP